MASMVPNYDCPTPREHTVASIREVPAEEHAKMLDARYQEASAHVEEGNRLIREWAPIAQSCHAGLEALAVAQRQDMPEPSR